MTDIIKLKHERAADHRSKFATGMTATKTNDGMLQMVFFRDAMKVIDEDLKLSEEIDLASPPTGPIQVASQQTNIEQYREDVVTVVIPLATVDAFAKLLNKLNEAE